MDFLFEELLPLATEFFDFEAEFLDFGAAVFDLPSVPVPATFAPASTAPLKAPVAAPIAAPLTTSVTASAAWATMPFERLLGVFFDAEAFLLGAVLADDFVVLADLPASDFAVGFVVLAVADLEAEPDDFAAACFDADAPDLPAVEFADLLEEVDFAADEDFAAGFAAEDLLLAAEADLSAVFLSLVAAFAESFVLLVVAIAFSLKGFFTTYASIFTLISGACQEKFYFH